MSSRILSRGAAPLVFVLAALSLAIGTFARIDAAAQFGQQAPPPPAPPVTPRANAPFDLTGYWASAVTEDWQWRFVTPAKGDFIAVPLNSDADKIAKTWDREADITAGNQCKPFGAAAITRLPTRMHITWEDDKTLKLEFDLGTQTRIASFDKTKQPGPRSLQGHAIAEWVDLPAPGGRGGGGGRGAAPAGRGGATTGAGDAAAAGDTPADTSPPGGGAAPAADSGRGGDGGRAGRGGRGGDQPRPGGLKIVTTNLSPQYLRMNGVPISENATVTDYIDRVPAPNGDQWLIVKTIVEDPTYLTQPYITSQQFKLEPDAAKWNPTPCEFLPQVKQPAPLGR